MKNFDYLLEVKGLDESGQIEGLAASYGNLDLGGDIIMPGALKNAVSGRKTVPMLLYHDLKRPVGVWQTLSETSEGLLVKGRISVKTRDGQDAYAMASDGALAGLSIGYLPVRHQKTARGRELHEISLHEVSLVSVPMNERTRVLNVKDILEAGELPSLPVFEDHLRDACGFSRSQAKAIASHGLKHLLNQREAGQEDDDAAAFLRALLPA
jgi:HK97 family phage prohead protease